MNDIISIRQKVKQWNIFPMFMVDNNNNDCRITSKEFVFLFIYGKKWHKNEIIIDTRARCTAILLIVLHKGAFE